MSRIGNLSAFLMPIVALTIGCGGGDESNTASRSAVPQEDASEAAAAEEPGREAIPPPMPEAVEGLEIAPYFDEAGTQTTLAVEPGEVFTVYIVARHPDYDMGTSQWKMTVPEGVTVVGESKTFEQALSIGTYKEVYVISYPCQAGGEPYCLLKYGCTVSPEFEGGTFETVKAVSAHSQGKEPPFLGFLTCGNAPETIPAFGGSAKLTKK
jgi:hypothetical protein